MALKPVYVQLVVGIVFGSIIACSPTRFSQKPAAGLCDNSVTNCITQSGFVDVTQTFKVGSGKVDILFVNDNSASMSKVQVQLASRFAGFIQNLDSRDTDYRIAITTTDLNSVQQNRLITFENGSQYITKADSNRTTLFNNAIMRKETIDCEDFIIGMFNTFGTGYQQNSQYNSGYSTKCPSSDTRGIYTANLVVSENSGSFMRPDANLNVIVISNDNVRQGKYALEDKDTASGFTNMMQQQYSNKYWDFNSIVVKDQSCKAAQTLRNASNQAVTGIAGELGIEYANLSNSAAKDIDGNPRPRGKILDICQSDYAGHFNAMATQISEDSRLFSMRCTPMVAPNVTVLGNSNQNVQHTWNGDKLVFSRGSEGALVSITYRCYTGPT